MELPKQIWTLIFNYLKVHDISIIARVSKLFYLSARNFAGELQTCVRNPKKLLLFCSHLQAIYLIDQKEVLNKLRHVKKIRL